MGEGWAGMGGRRMRSGGRKAGREWGWLLGLSVYWRSWRTVRWAKEGFVWMGVGVAASVRSGDQGRAGNNPGVLDHALSQQQPGGEALATFTQAAQTPCTHRRRFLSQLNASTHSCIGHRCSVHTAFSAYECRRGRRGRA